MLGRFEVVSPDGAPATFRSRKVGSLLAILALNKGREIANSTLQELLWPESDGDRQAQSLRRAVADLRQAMPVGDAGRSIVHADHGRVGLAPDCLTSDTERFAELLAPGAEAEAVIRGAEALALYGGPLLAPLDDEWVYAYRRQFEEMYCRGVEAYCERLVAAGQAREAARIASDATVVAREREEPYLAAIRAYIALGNRSMALQQFEALESMLDDVFGQSPSDAAISALEAPTPKPSAGESPETSKQGPTTLVSGGAIDVESRFYVERETDFAMHRALDEREPVVLVFGPRQVGKTSLLARSASQLREEGAQVVVTDFQSFGKSEVDRATTLYRSLIHSMATQLGLTYEPSWNDWIGPNSNLDAHIDGLLRQTVGRVCWAMDEVDRVFGSEYADDFFGLVRSWHNRQALDPGGPWSRLSLIISYATEAHLFIKDLNQSPFNVGLRINLRDFSDFEVDALGSRYASHVADSSKAVFQVTNGHPFLTRRAFGYLESGRSVADLRDNAASDNGPFAEHLHRLYETVVLTDETRKAVIGLLRGDENTDKPVLMRLVSAGLLDLSLSSFRVPAYEVYLRGLLL